ncbi:hypothetical protein V5799_033633 [Amblyomma americanum]|uniref:MAM domain-containing protein n=1 Tax=Amblyomma americanum TaxID=6943 RepID=A0AAQ4DMR7_AMBAM
MTCTFESGDCGWQLNNWVVTTGTKLKEPATDHNAQAPAGAFALMTSRKGRMLSPPDWYNASRHKCLRFWYYITGKRSMLSVFEVVGERVEGSAWYETTDNIEVHSWRLLTFQLKSSHPGAAVMITGSATDDPDSVVAVDDIHLSQKDCLRRGSCSFEEDMCGWASVPARCLHGRVCLPSFAQWYRHRGSTSSRFSQLEADHTLGSSDGYYLLLDGGDQSKQRGGGLWSEILKLGPIICFKMYYYVTNGNAVLHVLLLDAEELLKFGTATVNTTVTNSWTLFTLEHEDIPSHFAIIISASFGHVQSDIAIDDIEISPGVCRKMVDVSPTALPSSTPLPALGVYWRLQSTAFPTTKCECRTLRVENS